MAIQKLSELVNKTVQGVVTEGNKINLYFSDGTYVRFEGMSCSGMSVIVASNANEEQIYDGEEDYI